LTQRDGFTIFGPFLGVHCASFYVAGDIYNVASVFCGSVVLGLISVKLVGIADFQLY